MAFTTGTATDYHNLLDKLRLWLTGVGEAGTPTFSGTGTGTMTNVSASSSSVTETWTMTCTATATDGGTFSVSGSVSGAKADATVGIAYDNGLIAFTINDGTTDFALNDQFTVEVTGNSNQWTQLRWTAPATITDTAELWVRGPGAGPDRRVIVGIQTGVNTALPAYGWELRGAISFDSTMSFSQQNGISPGSWFNTWNNSIPYWFYANDRRFIVVTQVSTSYVCMYAGFFLPFALPSEYPFPLFIAGNKRDLDVYDANVTHNRMFSDPGVGSAHYRRRSTGDWREANNHESGTGNTSLTANGAALWPYRATRVDTSADGGDWTYYGLFKLRPNANGEAPLWQCHIIDDVAETVAGALDGVFASTGFDRSTGQALSANGRSFRMFQNVFRSTPRDFIFVEEI